MCGGDNQWHKMYKLLKYKADMCEDVILKAKLILFVEGWDSRLRERGRREKTAESVTLILCTF